MSATVDIPKYMEFFKDFKPRIFRIPGEKPFPVEIHYTDEKSNKIL